MERISKAAKDATPTKVISLVAPLDFSNFHYLKKILQLEFVKYEPPSAEVLAKGKIMQLLESAKASPAQNDERTKLLCAQILDSSNLDQSEQAIVIAYLVHTFLNPIQASGPAARPERDRDEGSDDRRPYSGQPRGDRGDRNDRGDRGGDRGGNRGRSSGRNSQASSYQEGDEGGYDSRNSGDSEGYDSARNDRGRRPEQRPREARGPLPKDTRFYIGAGSNAGFTEDEFKGLLKTSLAGTEHDSEASLLKRFTLRDLYSFADVPEQAANFAFDLLREASRANGEKLFICKATTISALRNDESRSDDSEGDSLQGSAKRDDWSGDDDSDSSVKEDE